MENVLGILTGLSLGVTFIVIGLPLWQARVRPNRWYGFRTRATLSDTTTWYEVNQVTGRLMTIAGFVQITLGLLGILAINDPHQQTYLAAICMLTAMLCLTYAGIQGYRKSKSPVFQRNTSR